MIRRPAVKFGVESESSPILIDGRAGKMSDDAETPEKAKDIGNAAYKAGDYKVASYSLMLKYAYSRQGVALFLTQGHPLCNISRLSNQPNELCNLC